MTIEIAPALEPEEWADRRSGVVSLDGVFDTEYVVIQDADGDRVTVSGSNEIFALIALANDALPEGDPRKITREQVNAIDNAGRQYYVHVAALRHAGFHADAEKAQRDAALIERLVESLAALLPPQESRTP